MATQILFTNSFINIGSLGMHVFHLWLDVSIVARSLTSFQLFSHEFQSLENILSHNTVTVDLQRFGHLRN